MQTPVRKKHIKVLFMDNDVDFLKSAELCLKLHGDYEIDSAFSVAEALEKISKQEIDVIICDIHMPVIDGLQFLKALREQNNNIPFIVFTITQDKEKALRAFNLGANGFVGKSGDPEVIFSTLKRYIDKATSF
jgi:DNA-binding NarL/FixJ family response regulator